MDHRKELPGGWVIVARRTPEGDWEAWVEDDRETTQAVGRPLWRVAWTALGFDEDREDVPDWLERWADETERLEVGDTSDHPLL